MLRDIERRVLNDIDIRPTQVAVVAAAVGGIVLAAAAAGVGELGASWVGPVDGAAVAVLGFHVAVSLVAVAARDFRWCCAAVLSGGLGGWLAVMTFWLHSSAGPTRDVSADASAMIATSLLVIAVSAALSTAAWLTVVARPLGSSHPDRPMGDESGRRHRHHADDGFHR